MAGMKFPLPNFPREFEIPDEWLDEAGFRGFKASTPSFRTTADAMLIPVAEIEPPRRLPSSPLDRHGFVRAKMINVLGEIVTDVEIKPVPTVLLPELDDRLVRAPASYRCRTYSYRTQDGFHRFYSSVAAEFEYLPATITTVAELVQSCRDLGWCE
jgi:hypothetical protein